MTMTVSVLIPYRAGCPHRDAALEWLVARFAVEYPSWEVLVADGDGDQGGWSKGAALAVAAARASGEVLVVSDADVWCAGTPISVANVRAGAQWSMPHRYVRRLSVEATAMVLAGEEPSNQLGLDREPYKGVRGGGLVVVQHAVLDRIPLDPRFVGWGGDDISWGDALYALAKRQWRGEHTLWHLWHPPQERMNIYVGTPENAALMRRYRRARTRPLQMQAIVDELLAGRPSTV